MSARYFWPDSNTVVLVREVDDAQRVYGGERSSDGARLGYAMSDLADRVAFEVWFGAREGTESHTLAGR
ncbi:MAG: hypothetical protein ACKVVT_18000 [Dehalococcoidia bacterium]